MCAYTRVIVKVERQHERKQNAMNILNFSAYRNSHLTTMITLQSSPSHLVRSPPVLLCLKHPLPKHRHHLWVVLICEGVLGDLRHETTVGSPCVVVCCLSYLRLHLRVVHDHIGPVRGGGVERGNDEKAYCKIASRLGPERAMMRLVHHNNHSTFVLASYKL